MYGYGELLHKLWLLSISEFVTILKLAVLLNGVRLWKGDGTFNSTDFHMRISHSHKSADFRRHFVSHFLHWSIASVSAQHRTLRFGLGFICPGFVNSSPSRIYGPVWMKHSPEGRSAPTRPLEGAWPRGTKAVQVTDRHGFEDCQREHRSDVR